MGTLSETEQVRLLAVAGWTLATLRYLKIWATAALACRLRCRYDLLCRNIPSSARAVLGRAQVDVSAEVRGARGKL